MILTIREHINLLAHHGRLNKKAALAVLDIAPDSPLLDKLAPVNIQIKLDTLSTIHRNAPDMMKETGIYPPCEEEPGAFSYLHQSINSCITEVRNLYAQAGATMGDVSNQDMEQYRDYYDLLRKEAARAERQASRRYTAFILKELSNRGYDIPVEKTGKYMCAIIPMLPWKEILDGRDIELAVDRYLETRTVRQLENMQKECNPECCE